MPLDEALRFIYSDFFEKLLPEAPKPPQISNNRISDLVEKLEELGFQTPQLTASRNDSYKEATELVRRQKHMIDNATNLLADLRLEQP